MFYGRNKKCVVQLAKANFANCRNRNIVIVLAIVLTTVLFTSLATIGMGAYKSTQVAMQMQKGSKADADLRYMTEKQFSKLEKNNKISEYGCRRPIGFLNGIKNHNIELDYMDSIQQELTFSVPSHGKAPEKANEIATTDAALKSLGIEPEIGKTVSVEFELRGKTYQYNMTLSGWWEASNAQTSIMLVSKRFMEENQEIFPYTYDNDREYAGTYFSDIILKSGNNASAQLKQIIRDIGGEPENSKAPNYIASAVNRVTNPETNWTLGISLLVFISLFIFAGYLLIYNVFEISIMQEVQKYGLLKTIGTTQKQIAFSVRLQAVWLLLIALPIGLLSGYFIGKAVLPLTMQFISGEYSSLEVIVKPNFMIFAVATMFTIITVLISIRKPTKIAANISAVDALRYLEGKENSKSKKRSKRITIVGLANDSLRRNKKRTVFIIISMSLCCILLNSAVTAVNSIDIEKAVKNQCAADVIVASGNTFNNMKGFTTHEDRLDEDICQSIEETLPIKNYGLIYKNTLDDAGITIDYGIKRDEVVKENGRNYVVADGYSIPLGKNGYPVCNVYGIDQNVFSRTNINEKQEKIGDNQIYEQMVNENYVIEAVSSSLTSKITKNFQTNVGDTIDVYTETGEVKQFEVLAHVYVSPTEYEIPNVTTGISTVGGDAPLFYFSTEKFMELYKKPTLMSATFDVSVGELQNVDGKLANMVEQSQGKLGYTTVELLRANMNGIRQTILVLGVFISAILGLAGLINFINLMISNIIVRKREYAVMQSIGMTNRQIKKMLVAEGLQYAGIAGILGVGLSFAFGDTLLKSISSSIWFFTFKLTLWPAIVIVAVTVILAGLIPLIILKTFDKSSIVEKLRITN